MNLKSIRFKHKILPFTASVLVILQAVLVLVSWIITSVFPSLSVKSMLSEEGIRWFLGNFTVNMMSVLLVWLLLASVAWGAFLYSGLYGALRHLRDKKRYSYRQSHALRIVFVVAVIILVLVILLAFIPHAILLGVSGSLFPSAFSAGFVPLLSFSLTVLSIVYGLVDGHFTNLYSIFRSLYVGLYMSAPLCPVYILAVQLYSSVKYVFFS